MRHLWAQRQIARRHFRFIAIQGFLGVAGFNSLIYMVMQTTTAINAVLVNSCIPVLIALFSWILYKDVMTPRQCLGVLVAALLWALYSANLKKYPQELHPFAYLSGIVISGLIGIFPWYLMEVYSGKVMAVNAATIVTILYVAVFAYVLAFIFWNRAVRRVGANKAEPFIHLMPVFSTILAVLFLGETLHGYHLQGIVLIFCGILMTTFRISKR